MLKKQKTKKRQKIDFSFLEDGDEKISIYPLEIISLLRKDNEENFDQMGEELDLARSKVLKISFMDKPAASLLKKIKYSLLKRGGSKRYSQASIDDLMEHSAREEIFSVYSGNHFIPEYYKVASRVSLSFLGICLAVVSLIGGVAFFSSLIGHKDIIIGSAVKAVDNLGRGSVATSNFDVRGALSEFDQARQGFLLAQDNLKSVSIWVKAVTLFSKKENDKYNFAEKMLTFGVDASEAAQFLAQALDKISNDSGQSITEQISEAGPILQLAQDRVIKMDNIMRSFDIDQIPPEYVSKWVKMRTLLPILKKDIGKFTEIVKISMDLLGAKEQKRYLLVFQNSAELRPTGGFIGSLALLDMYKGKIKKMEIPGGGPYDLRGGLMLNVNSPQPLRLVNSRWEFQDANWFVDWPESSLNLRWFYSKSGGTSVDGVIGLDIFLLQKILKLTGPVDMPSYKMKITADNFLEKIQNYVEFDYDKIENKPKKIIADLAPILLKRLFNLPAAKYIEAVSVLNESLIEKNLLLNFRNPVLEKKIIDLGWGGEVKMTNKDYLMVVNTNISGGKTDAVVKEGLSLITRVDNDGRVFNELTIIREHEGKSSQPLTGLKNIDYMRIYVPKGSRLVSAVGFEPISQIYFLDENPDGIDSELLGKVERNIRWEDESSTRISDEFGKTVFANWVQLGVGETKKIKIIYELPFRIKFESRQKTRDIIEKARRWFYSQDDRKVNYYSLYVQKQPGSRGDSFRQRISFPSSWYLGRGYPDNIQVLDNDVLVEDVITQDKFYGVFIHNKKQ